MKWKDTEGDAVTGSEGGDLAFDGNRFSLKNDAGDKDLRMNLFQKNRMPVIMAAAGVVVLLIVAWVLFSGGGRSDDTRAIALMASQIKRLEERIARMEKTADLSPVLNQQAKQVAGIAKRMDRLEKSLVNRIDEVSKRLASLKQKPLPVRPRAVSALPPARDTGTTGTVRYHEVKAGENLYRISLRYNLKLEELRRLNQLGPDAVLRTGQKLVIGR